jgi:hypothetical protein
MEQLNGSSDKSNLLGVPKSDARIRRDGGGDWGFHGTSLANRWSRSSVPPILSSRVLSQKPQASSRSATTFGLKWQHRKRFRAGFRSSRPITGGGALCHPQPFFQNRHQQIVALAARHGCRRRGRAKEKSETALPSNPLRPRSLLSLCNASLSRSTTGTGMLACCPRATVGHAAAADERYEFRPA